MVVCHGCGSVDVDADSGRVDVVCMQCGLVLSESSIVSEVNFSDNPTGSSSVVGQFVSVSGSRGLSASAKRGGAGGGGGGAGGGGLGGGGSGSGYGRDSREQTLSAGRKLCQQLSDALRLKAHHVDAAHRYFALAVQHNFIQGRRTRNVVASCLYIVCRREKTSHLLLDFADVLQTNLYVLGATLLKFLKVLHIALPIIDPSLYIHRFAAQLEIGSGGGASSPSTSSPPSPSGVSSDAAATVIPSPSSSSGPQPSSAGAGRASVHVVAMTALRLVARMKRDWLQVGRRPSGICGACLLIACRMHGYRRSQREILDVVKVCDATLRRRMVEFVATRSSELTFSEFESETEEQHRGAGGGGAALGKAAVLASNGGAEEAGANPPAFTRACEAEAAAVRAAQRKAELVAQLEAKKITEEDVGRQWDAEVQRLLQSPSFQHIGDRQPVLLHEDASQAAIQRIIRQHTRQGKEEPAEANSSLDPALAASPTAPTPVDGIEEGEQLLASLQAIGAVIAPTAGASSALLDDDGVWPVKGGEEEAAAAASATSSAPSTASSPPSAAALPVFFVDDSCVDEYLLSEEEVKFKTALWEEIHSAYLAAQKTKAALQPQPPTSGQSPHAGGPSSSQPLKGDSSAPTEGPRRGGGGGSSASGGPSGVNKKEKVTQSVAFLAVTGSLPPPPSSAAANSPSLSSSAATAPSPSRHPLPSPPPSSSAAPPASALAPKPSSLAFHSSGRRVSGKINYERLAEMMERTRELQGGGKKEERHDGEAGDSGSATDTAASSAPSKRRRLDGEAAAQETTAVALSSEEKEEGRRETSTEADDEEEREGEEELDEDEEDEAEDEAMDEEEALDD